MLKKLHILLHIDELNNPTLTPASKSVVPVHSIFKRDLASLVLFCYVLLIFNPATPIIADIMAHTFWEKQHLLTVHQVNGKYHVHFELMRAAHQADSNKSSGSLKPGSDDYLHVVFNVKYHFLKSNYFTKHSYPPYSSVYQPDLHTDIDYPPPRV